MKFEEIIKKLSAFVASFIVFFLAAGMYLSLKGFVMTPNGQILLIREAEAKPVENKVKENANLILPKNYILGKRNAPVAIYEYSSLGCFHCADFHLSILPKLKKEYVDSGKVKVIYSDFPLEKKSMQAAMVARCMPTKEKYYDFITLLYKKQREWSLARNPEKMFIDYAALNGISKEQAAQCLQDKKIADEIVDIRSNAIQSLGIKGTPSLLIISGDDREVIQGVGNYDELKKIIDERLAQK